MTATTRLRTATAAATAAGALILGAALPSEAASITTKLSVTVVYNDMSPSRINLYTSWYRSGGNAKVTAVKYTGDENTDTIRNLRFVYIDGKGKSHYKTIGTIKRNGTRAIGVTSDRPTSVRYTGKAYATITYRGNRSFATGWAKLS